LVLVGAILLFAFVLHERRTRAPMMPLDLFRIPTFAGVNALTLLLYFALSGALLFLPTALIEAHGYSAARAGSVFLPFTLVMALLSRWGGALADRFGVQTFLTIGPVLTGLSFALLYPAVQNGGYWSAIVPVMAFMGLGMGITVAPLSTTVMNAVPTKHAGIASGINNAIARVAGLIAVASLGALATLGFQLTIASADPSMATEFARATFGAPPPMEGLAAAIRELHARATIGGFGLVSLVCAGAAILSGYFGYRASGA
jgi:predicted MFS family arabinose efflux permease